MKGKYDYVFKVVNPDEFEATMIIPIKGKIMQSVFQKSKKKLEERGIVFEKTIEGKESFYVEEKYLNLMNTAAKRLFKKVKREVASDGIIVVSDEVTKALYVNHGSFWLVNVHYKGFYSDQR